MQPFVRGSPLHFLVLLFDLLLAHFQLFLEAIPLKEVVAQRHYDEQDGNPNKYFLADHGGPMKYLPDIHQREFWEKCQMRTHDLVAD